jgi:uncharacterized membrane-anchored protein
MNNVDFKCVLTQAVLTGVVVYLLVTYIIQPSPITPSTDKSRNPEMSISLYAALAALVAGWLTGFIQPSCPQKSTLF